MTGFTADAVIEDDSWIVPPRDVVKAEKKRLEG